MRIYSSGYDDDDDDLRLDFIFILPAVDICKTLMTSTTVLLGGTLLRGPACP